VIDHIGIAYVPRSAGDGGTILHGPSEIPAGEYLLTAVDPQGAVFGLVGPRK